MNGRQVKGIRGIATILVAGLLAIAGCGSSGGGDSDAAGGDSKGEGAGGLTVLVVYHGETRSADLSEPAQTQLGGLPFVKLSDVVKLAFPDIDLGKVTADFIAADGFKPGSKANCAALIPVAGALLAQGYISPTTRNLAWDDSLQYPGCMRVSDTSEIAIADE